MKKWKLVCPAGDGFTKTVAADTKDEAVVMFLADPEMQEHAKLHPENAAKMPEEAKQMVADMVTEETGIV